MLKSTVDKIGVDVKELPLFKGYVVFLAFRWFWFSYWTHLTSAFKNIEYGNIMSTIMSPLTLFVDVWKLTNTHVLETMQPAFEAYRMFTE